MFVLPLTRSASRATAPHFNRVVDRLFDESFDRYFGGAAAGARTPALDVSETDTAYTVAFDVPGATREQLKVSVEGRRVSIETATSVKNPSGIVTIAGWLNGTGAASGGRPYTSLYVSPLSRIHASPSQPHNRGAARALRSTGQSASSTSATDTR